jgi:integrase
VKSYGSSFASHRPIAAGARRDRKNVLNRVVRPTVKRANELRAPRGQPSILAHVTPHTFRRTYITFMVVAGYDLPYIQVQVGHADPPPRSPSTPK